MSKPAYWWRLIGSSRTPLWHMGKSLRDKRRKCLRRSLNRFSKSILKTKLPTKDDSITLPVSQLFFVRHQQLLLYIHVGRNLERKKNATRKINTYLGDTWAVPLLSLKSHSNLPPFARRVKPYFSSPNAVELYSCISVYSFAWERLRV